MSFRKNIKLFNAFLLIIIFNFVAIAQANELVDAQSNHYDIDQESFAITMNKSGHEISISLAQEKRKVENFNHVKSGYSWEYPEAKISVEVKTVLDYLSVTISSRTEQDNIFVWPSVLGESYLLPLGEGKRIGGNDSTWIKYLDGKEFSVLEQLSMPFWASTQGDYAVVYILENPYRSSLNFTATPELSFSLAHSYPKIDSEKKQIFRIYVCKNNIREIAKIYKDYLVSNNKFRTLEEKRETNPNIEKLYGAPHIYLWGENLLSPQDIKWQAFRSSLNNQLMQYLKELIPQTSSGAEFTQVLHAISKQDYVDQYQKNIVCSFLSEVLKMSNFYDQKIFPKSNPQIQALLQLESLNEFNLLQLNQLALAYNFQELFVAQSEWLNSETTALLKDFKAYGLDRAWIGLNSWEQAYAKPELVEIALNQDYLIATYDSYHSIHEPGKEKWITAKFSDSSLYEKATVADKNGEKINGFQNVGRKLNPTLASSSVEQRVDGIMEAVPFNSWFIDCDATGEIYDDYSPEHLTTQQEDLAARLQRMSYIRDKHKLVIGSEGGHDFAASTIAFAHGIELKTFSWIDPDMNKNKNSQYYIGKYFSPTGGVAEHFAKRVPIKDEYYTIFVDPKYDIPLFKLVYNDSVITSYHWDWSTFKIKGVVRDRMLREVLYNVPPLYHLDRTEWEKYKTDISAHTQFWSNFSKKAIYREMTDFQILKSDGSVQRTAYEDDLQVIANFSDIRYNYENSEIPPHSLLLLDSNKKTIYTPQLLAEHN